MNRLYPSLSKVADFVRVTGLADRQDSPLRAKGAIARYIAELPEDELAECRADWMKYAGYDPSAS